MKKLLVLLLVLAMLVPMCLTQPAKAADAVTKKNFYALGWSDFDQVTYPHLDGLYQLNWGNLGGNIDLAEVRYDSPDMEAKAEALAQRVKKAMLARPEGMRYIHTFGPAAQYRLAPEDALFFDFAIEQMAAVMDIILKKMKEIDCPLDGIVVDLEYVGLSTYYLVDTNGDKYQDNNLLANPNLLRDIVKNPKYKTQIRPMLEEWGFIFYDAGDPAKQASFTELYSITKNAGSKYARSRNVWNAVVRNHLNNTVTQWAYDPLMKYYPEANVSDYQSYDSATWQKMTQTTDDGTEMNGGNSLTAGDTGTTSFYYNSPGSNEMKHFTGMNDAIYPNNAYKNFMYEVNKAKAFYAASETKKFAPWITSYVYGGEKSYSLAYTEYYSELLYHLGLLCDPQPFLSYTYVNEYKESGKDPSFTSPKYILTSQAMNDALAELSRVAGYSDRKPIELPVDWNSKYMLSGMYANGRNIWRITPNTDVIGLSEFHVDAEKDPTFSVNGKTITFPGGTIIEDTTIANSGSCGFWVETAKDVTPVVTTEAERYEYYPSLIYDFETYKSGAFDYNTSKPKDAWKFEWGKTEGGIQGVSNILSIDANNKLAIIGNSKNWIKELPTNITAGDSFAEEQTWELAVTIPEGLSEKAQIDILNYTGNKQEISDGGFMVKGGKLYYSIGKEDANDTPIYKELMDIDGGSTYLFKRSMNFHHKGYYYCTYTVCSGNGRVLKTVEEIPVPDFNYITQIGFGVTEADKNVIVDNFKIFLCGATADFSVYDARTGQDAELGEARDRSTAYRLSWLNASYDEHTGTIKADITAGGKTETKVLHEVKMMPGNDGIITGKVDIKEGETVKIYLETTVVAPANPFVLNEETAPLVDSVITEGTLTEIPEALKKAGLDTVEKIQAALQDKLLGAEGIDGLEEFGHYLVQVEDDQLPKHGKMTVIMPYPEGTDANYTFVAAQIYITDDYGKKVGDIELLKAINTSEGIQFEITGTSPIALGWNAPDAPDGRIPMPPTDERKSPTAVKVQRPTEAPEEEEEPEETEYVEETEAPEETETPIETTIAVTAEKGGVPVVLIIVIAFVVLSGAGVAIFFLLKKKPAAPAPQNNESPETPEE